MKKFVRNDTGFPLRLAEYVSSIRADSSYPFLKYYQNIVRIMLSADMQTRGLLVDHEMGLGKSILAIAVAIDMMPDRQPIILLAKSLAENMRGSIVKYVKMRAQYDKEWPLGRFSAEELDSWISANFSFVSMNASNMLQQVGRAVTLDKKLEDILEQVTNLDGKLLIVDEAHNLFRAIVNGSKNGLGLYNLVQKSRNLKIIFLTGTPIANDPFELVPCFNMLSGAATPVLPEDYIEFTRLYVDADGRLKNREKFQNRLFGLVSSIKYKWLDLAQPRGEFPELKPLITVRVRMDHVQYTSYSLAREKEKEESSRPGRGAAVRVALVKPKTRGASTYRVKSRQIGNYDAHDETGSVKSPKFEAIYANVQRHDGQKGLVYSQFVGAGGLLPFRKFLDEHGWSEIGVGNEGAENIVSNKNTDNTDNTENTTTDPAYDEIDGGGPALPSATEYLDRMIAGAGETTTGWWLGAGNETVDIPRRRDPAEYDISVAMMNDTMATPSALATPSDVNTDIIPIDAALSVGAATGKQYVMITGEVPVESRTRVQELFNDPASGCDLIIVSSTGAEGLDLKRVRHIHIMEPYWNWGRIDQIIARGVRNDSHIDLPPDQKNVQGYIYLAIPPESEDDGLPTTDVELYEDSLKNRDSVASFLDAIDEVSIECTLGGRNCRMCNPTGEPLFSDDPTQDVRTRDTCTPYRDEEITVSEITIDGTEYKYAPNAESVYGIKIFEFDKELGAYRALKESNPLYQRIYHTLNPDADM
jgi:superfamily II DNA or RNA helicase